MRWPDADEVRHAFSDWARHQAQAHPGIVRIGCFGSYARGDWGVGSDLDIVVLVRKSREPFTRRAAAFDATVLPVPADVLVYTLEEWGRRDPARDAIERDVAWVFHAKPD